MAPSFKSIWDKIAGKKSVPAVGFATELTRNGIQRAYIPRFLWKPPFGYPRYVDLPNIRRLAAMPYVDMCITTIVDEACAVKWDIVAKPGKENSPTFESHRDQVLEFYENPNTNKESFTNIRRKYLRDILEIDSGVINKVFNMGGQMVEIAAKDGATFTKNPDMFGMYTDRDDIIQDSGITQNNRVIQDGMMTPDSARDKAAYFQYGWISGARPVPFGKKEIVWMERNPRTDNLYGRSPVEILAETIQTLIYAIEHNLEYFNDNSIPKGLIGLEGAESDEIEAFKEQWVQQQMKQDGAGNWKKKFHDLPVVGKIPKFERLQFSNAELELLEGQKWWAKLVWACFGVTSVELGYTEDSKGLANQIVQSNVFKKRALNPLLRMEEYHHNHEIISEFEFDDVEFKFLQFDVDEEMKKAQLYAAQLAAGYKSINEVRADEGLDPVEWGEKKSYEEMQRIQNNIGNQNNDNLNKGSLGNDEANAKKDSKEKTENMKSIEGKPGMGRSDEWWSIYHALIKEGHNEEEAAKIASSRVKKKDESKALSSVDNPLILREGEVVDEDRLEKVLIYSLEKNKEDVLKLIESEMKASKLNEVKSLSGIAKAIKKILSFVGLKKFSDAAIGVSFNKGWDDAEKDLGRNLIVNKAAIDFIQDYTFDNIKGMTEEVADDLRGELQRSIMANESLQKVKARVEKVFSVGTVRASMIARTEVNRAENHGKLQAYKSSGEKELKKKWVSAHDERTSEICNHLDGQVVGMDEDFKDSHSGWEGPCPPAHINCRSTMIFIKEDEE